MGNSNSLFTSEDNTIINSALVIVIRMKGYNPHYPVRESHLASVALSFFDVSDG